MENRSDIVQCLRHRIFVNFIVIIKAVPLLLTTDALYAGEWEITPTIEVSGAYDDNVRLGRDGSERSDYITEVNPGFSIEGIGRQTELILDYKMQNVFYQHNGDDDSTYHHLNARSNSEFIRDKLFLTASVDYTQRNINNESASGFDNTSIGDNRTDVVIYTITPYFLHAFGNAAIFRLEHSFQEIDNKDEDLVDADTKTNTTSIKLRSGPSFTDLKWDLSHQEQVTDYRERPDIENRDSKLSLRYYFSSKVYLIGIFGQEKYNYDVEAGQEKPEGNYWDAGLGWTPSHRTRLEITQGEHYYGDKKGLDLSHRTKQSTWGIRYSEDIFTTSTFKSEEDVVQIYNPETGMFEEYGSIDYFNIAAVTLNKSLVASVSKVTAKTSLTITLSKIKREYLNRPSDDTPRDNAPSDDEITSLDVLWDWQFASRTGVLLSSTLTESEISTSANKSTNRRSGIRFSHKNSKRTKTYFSISNDSQRTDVDGVLYRRNVYKIGFESRF